MDGPCGSGRASGRARAGRGTLRGLSPPLTGTLGELEIAPVVATLLYAPREFARFQPYVGAGAAYTYILDTESGDVAALEASSGWGAVLQAGCNFAITPQLWAFADARKIYSRRPHPAWCQRSAVCRSRQRSRWTR